MDPASAILGIVSFGLTVFAKINAVCRAIKGASKQVQVLQELSVAVTLLLDRLQKANTLGDAFSFSTAEAAYLDCLCAKARCCLNDVETMVDKVVDKTSSVTDGITEPKVRLKKWIMSRERLTVLADRMKELRELLDMILQFTQSIHLQYIVNTIKSGTCRPFSRLARLGCLTTGPSNETCSRSTLHCPHDCACLCHTASINLLIPSWLSPYVGQIFLSKGLLRPPWSSWNICNVQTCRGDFLTTPTVVWLLPPSTLSGSFQSSQKYPLHFTVAAPREISWSAPIWDALRGADLQLVRTLFETRQASIWDVDVKGWSLFRFACFLWQLNPCDAMEKIVQFYVEAGAVALLFAEPNGSRVSWEDCTALSGSAHDILVLGLFKQFLEEKDTDASYAKLIRTSAAGIHTFRSLFNLDPLDALEDFLTRKGSNIDDVSAVIQRLHDEPTENNFHLRQSIFQAIGPSPLEYAVMFSPQRVQSLIAGGSSLTASTRLRLASVVFAGRTTVIKLFVEAGAGINIVDGRGLTPLLSACRSCLYSQFLELVRWAEHDIDWDARSPDGESALDLLDVGLAHGCAELSGLSESNVDEFRSILQAHMGATEASSFEPMNGAEEDESFSMPGSFPSVDEIAAL